MLHMVGTVVDNTCNTSCQYDWLSVSSNFFNVSVYTPALVIGLGAFFLYRFIKKARSKK